MELDIKHTIVFSKNLKSYEDGKRFIVNQGGARSSKTYSIIQLLIYLCLTIPSKKVSVVRKSFPSLRGSVLKDFMEIMINLNIYSEDNHNKTEQYYKFSNGSILEFFSIDDAQKVRGRKRDICYCNEANELTFDDFQQLSLRTSGAIFLDYNPSDNEHFLYKLIEDERSILIKSTYKDNIYLSPDIIIEIENLINIDENYYKIYALGEKPIPHTRVYTHFGTYDKLPSNIDDVVYGADWGFNHPTALIKLHYSDDVIYVEEILYKSKLTSSDIVREFDNLRVDKKSYIYSDYARPEIIEELRRAGYNMKEAVKDVKQGIDAVKTRKIMVHKSATNILREYKMYSWKTNKDVILDEPIKLYDDALDALRYGVYSGLKKKFTK